MSDMKKIIIRKKEETAKAIESLRSGMPVIFPTETVYGIGALASNEKAIVNLYKLKKRDFSKPLALYFHDYSEILPYVKEVSMSARRLAEKYLPGPLTIILKASPCVNSIIRAGKDTVAIRIPDDELTLSLLKDLGEPLAGTSANISGRKSAADYETANEYFPEGIGAVLDSGPSPLKTESTLIDCSGSKIIIIRQGALELNTEII